MKLVGAQSSENTPGVLLSPKSTTFIVVDYQAAFESCFDLTFVKNAMGSIVELVHVADKMGIPIITSLVKTNRIASQISAALETKLPEMTRFNRSGINPWDDQEFVEAIRVANRPCLLIAGLSTETSLSFTALGALARGFDVFVIKDACLGYSEQSIAICFDRLVQAGVVPVSWRQVILELNQGNVDPRLLRRILRSRIC